jgi:hypothetical protein
MARIVRRPAYLNAARIARVISSKAYQSEFAVLASDRL